MEEKRSDVKEKLDGRKPEIGNFGRNPVLSLIYKIIY